VIISHLIGDYSRKNPGFCAIIGNEKPGDDEYVPG
jgi:hypothetical protein